MNKNIITLQGISNTGKTRTLKLLIDKIKANYNAQTIFDGNDRIIVATINDKKLGITTCGDRRFDLENDFKRMGSCDLYVCASRTKGSTISFLKYETTNGMLITHGKWYFEAQNYNVIISSVRNSFNEMQANIIYDEIVDILKQPTF